MRAAASNRKGEIGSDVKPWNSAIIFVELGVILEKIKFMRIKNFSVYLRFVIIV